MQNYRDMLQELLNVDAGLSDKEINFLDSLHDWTGNFTPKQIAWLDRIYSRVKGE